ncbi:hypothetical protein Agabi119p4_6230 [Agaricus bisporus var. burnettii]|uniref:Methyltransferase domain-containing protein n=1 Tax=Agaricus bisporus var. burnettii TaxID=192524 RepID=A0A8H7EZE9_AGABI|nr:hypothetical protein Agabi119p4_6230 [Agaricus bisporus var. burnettii]
MTTLVETKSSSVSYLLPKGGKTEFTRLDSQHRLWTLLVDGLYTPEIEEQIQQHMGQAKNPAILDVGCGSAIWSVEMAERFPSAQVIGVDITTPNHRSFPSDFSFRNRDLVNGLPLEFKAKFDIIHCRTVCQHIPNPQALVDCMADCLKPDGFLILADGDLSVGFDEDRKLLEPFIYDPSLSIQDNLKNTKGLSWHAGWLHAFSQSTRSVKYESPFTMAQKSKLLKEPTIKDLWIPYGWEGKDVKNGKELGEVTAEDFKQIYQFSVNTVFNKLDIPLEIKNALVERGLTEVSKRKTYLIGLYVVARKCSEAEIQSSIPRNGST